MVDFLLEKSSLGHLHEIVNTGKVNHPWEHYLTAFNRLSVKSLVCPMPLYYDLAATEDYQESKEEIHASLSPGSWAIRDVLAISKMNIKEITTRNINDSDLSRELESIVSTFSKKGRAPLLTTNIQQLLEYGRYKDRHGIGKLNDLWEVGMGVLLALETIEPRLDSFSRRVNLLMSGSMKEGEFKGPSHRNIPLPCAFQCVLFAVAERTMRDLLRKLGQEKLFDALCSKGNRILSALQSATDRSLELQKKYEWLITSPWLKVGNLYQTSHQHGTRQWNSALAEAFDQLKAELDADQQRFQDSGFRRDQHDPSCFSNSVKKLLNMIGPKSDEAELFDRQTIELAHCFIWWIYKHRDDKDIANLPSKADLNKCLPEHPSKIDVPYREGVCSFPRDRAKLYNAVGLSELKKGSGRKRGSSTTSGHGKIDELGHDLPKGFSI